MDKFLSLAKTTLLKSFTNNQLADNKSTVLDSINPMHDKIQHSEK